ncbi:MAG: PD-(D/E)XK nuclease family transposase [Synergistaceae bacterium]|nr:PD-(D/E)XK nuclease family transposase [Synergistaceae bacterium]
MITNEEKLAALQELTLMDDFFMRLFFRDNIPCAERMLRVILNRPDIVVESVKVQYVLTAGDNSRSVRLDIWAREKNGTQIDAEIQNDSSGASPQRARYNSAMLDVNILKPGEPYSVLKTRKSIVIFITEKDVLGSGEPIYLIDRIIRKSGKPFGDGSHIVYVNGSCQDISTELGRLMHDFHCVRPEDMFDPVFADKAGEMKGVKEVGVLDDWEREVEARGEARGKALGIAIQSESIAQNLVRLGTIALDEIAKACGLPLQRVQELAAGK